MALPAKDLFPLPRETRLMKIPVSGSYVHISLRRSWVINVALSCLEAVVGYAEGSDKLLFGWPSYPH